MDDREFRERIKVSVPTEREKATAYNKFIIDQQNPFILFINYINKYMNGLREMGIISNFLEIRARIKTSKSAFQNDQKKTLDDIFGMEFVCATEREAKVARAHMEQLVTTIRSKKHNKKNGYKAEHCVCTPTRAIIDKLNLEQNIPYFDELFPVIEMQFKTIAVDYEANYGRASHETYKREDMKEIQNLYNSGKLIPGIYIPYMWVSDLESNKMRELTTEETIKKMYPSLKLRDNSKDQKGHEEQ